MSSLARPSAMCSGPSFDARYITRSRSLWRTVSAIARGSTRTAVQLSFGLRNRCWNVRCMFATGVEWYQAAVIGLDSSLKWRKSRVTAQPVCSHLPRQILARANAHPLRTEINFIDSTRSTKLGGRVVSLRSPNEYEVRQARVRTEVKSRRSNAARRES